MADPISRLLSISVAPVGEDAFQGWLEGRDAIEFLKQNADHDDLVVYATPGCTFIHAVLVPSSNVEPPDVEDLLSWNFNAYSSWGVDVTSGPEPSYRLSAPFEHDSSKTFSGGHKLIFPRSFEGIVGGDKGYWEVLQQFVHVFGLHFLQERSAYCWLDKRGDVEDVIRILRFSRNQGGGGGTVITFKRQIVDEWMLLTGTRLVRTFDFTRYRSPGFFGWSDAVQRPRRVEEESIYHRTVVEPGHASYVRGCQIIGPRSTTNLARRFGWATDDPKEHASFIGFDWKNNEVREISCAPDATANYFTKSELPFEVSPAFFRPDVLLKYKADSDKYKLEDRSISCRSTWHLQTYDINDAGQVHTYIVYLRDLPYEEQLHWKAYNEKPRGLISRRSLSTDFKGEWDQEYEPLASLKQAVVDLDRANAPWWRLRSEKLLEQTHLPVTVSADEWANELLHLDQLVVEGFEEKWLRDKASSLGRKPPANFKSLKLIEECLVGLRFEGDHAHRITAPLHQLHLYRTKVKGHASGEDSVALRRAALSEYGTYRKHFQALCARCDESVRAIVDALKNA